MNWLTDLSLWVIRKMNPHKDRCLASRLVELANDLDPGYVYVPKLIEEPKSPSPKYRVVGRQLQEIKSCKSG